MSLHAMDTPPQLVRSLCALALWFVPMEVASAARHDEAKSSQSAVAALAAADAPSAIVRFRIADTQGQPLAGRLTFVGKEGPRALLFPNTQVRPLDLAVRNNVVYSLSGAGAIRVPVGEYMVYATCGLEWSRAEQRVKLAVDDDVALAFELAHEVDTRGWVSGDFHLHTYTHSGHGDANLNERVISLIGEGVEFAVATDHNHNTDYAPVVRELGAEARITSVVGNEISSPIGHMNAFPLDAARPVVNQRLRDANELFRLIRAEPNEYGIQPVIQLNHPRWYDIDFFRHTGLDPITGVSTSKSWSAEFDSIEILNANPGRGYYDADLAFAPGDEGRHSVLRDWFNLLNRGERHAAVGNSDSHTVHFDFAGWPRNYVPSSTDDPSRIDVREVAASVRALTCFTTLGPFVELRCFDDIHQVTGTPNYWDVLPDRLVRRHTNIRLLPSLAVRIRAASWIDVDRMKVIVDGDLVETAPVADSRQALRLDYSREIAEYAPEHGGDYWIAFLVEGDDPLDPIVVDQEQPARPIAIVNPLFIDADGDGKWTAPWETAKKLVDTTPEPADLLWRFPTRPSLRALFVIAALELRRGSSFAIVEAALRDPDRRVVLAAARAAQSLANARLLPALEDAWRGHVSDAYGKLVLFRALRSCDLPDADARFLELLTSCDLSVLRRYDDELATALPGLDVKTWQALGYFPGPRDASMGERGYGPEQDGDLGRAWKAKSGDARWKAVEANGSGYLDLRGLAEAGIDSVNAVAYAQTWLVSPDAREVAYALGTDDGGRVWINGALVHEDRGSHGAFLSQCIGKVKLHAGANRVVFEVHNGQGATGVVFRVLDRAIEVRAAP
jgi:hypothetical protein